MRIVEIEVEQLFGTFDHRIPLNTDDRITLIHGPNGFGKTILLEMVYGLFNGRYTRLRQIPFRQFVVRFDDGTGIGVHQSPLTKQQELLGVMGLADPAKELSRRSAHELQVVFHNGNIRDGDGEEFTIPSTPASRYPIGHPGHPSLYIPQEIPGLERIGSDSWVDASSGEIFTLEEVFEIYESPQLSLFAEASLETEPSWWKKIRHSVRVEMIREQRLVRLGRVLGRRQEPTVMVRAIEEYSTELAKSLEKKLAESVTLSQSLDRTFPARLLERIHAHGPSENELTSKLEELERKREKLRDAGLLDKQEAMPLLPTEGLGEQTRDVLAVYVEDAEKKLGIFEGLARKIELFQDIINSRFLYKRLHVSRKDGFVFTNSSGEPLPLSALSSGEQQEVVLLYELLFRLEPDSLVLIDEPEISLHVAWQKKFLEDLAKITDLASFDVLIATHSPQIIHERWDLTVELQSPRAEAELETAALP